MFKDNILSTFFIKSLKSNTSTQQFYKIYEFYLLGGWKVDFIELCLDTQIYLINFKGVKTSKTFLNFFFLFKTPRTLNVFFIKSFSKIKFTQFGSISFENNLLCTLNIFKNFWKKFKKLKRPKTEDNFNDFFLKSWKNKLYTYNQLGFILLQDSVYLVRCKSEIFFKTCVSVNKTMVVSPKSSSSSIYKFFDQNQLNLLEFQFLRKNKVYNKGRYSRCRQNYRTGVYMCMYLSVISIFGLYYWFYKFSFNFTYLWWLFTLFVGSFFLPKIIKYRLYEPTVVSNKFFDFFKWFFLVCKSFF